MSYKDRKKKEKALAKHNATTELCDDLEKLYGFIIHADWDKVKEHLITLEQEEIDELIHVVGKLENILSK